MKVNNFLSLWFSYVNPYNKIIFNRWHSSLMQIQQMYGEEQRGFSGVAPADKYPAYRLPIVLLTIRSLI